MKPSLGIVRRNLPRAADDDVTALRAFGVATVHEAMGRLGLTETRLRPVYPGATLCGTALTVLAQPGDNWMLHVAAEQIRPGDVVVVACTTDSTDGFFGDLLATSFRARGAVGLVIDGGCRDIESLESMNFPVFARAISARGTVKATLGSVNVPVVCAGALVTPGDVVIGDADGVVVVPRENVPHVIAASVARTKKEAINRARLASGELGLDIYDMRDALARMGLRYLDE